MSEYVNHRLFFGTGSEVMHPCLISRNNRTQHFLTVMLILLQIIMGSVMRFVLCSGDNLWVTHHAHNLQNLNFYERFDIRESGSPNNYHSLSFPILIMLNDDLR